MAETVLFYAFAAIILAGAVMVVPSRNVLYSALWLALTLLGVAAIFILLNAYFLAGIQVLIYIGAVVVLAIFVINLTAEISGKHAGQLNRQVIPAVLASLLTFVLIAAALLKTDWATRIASYSGADKTGLIGDATIIDMLENNYSGIFERDNELLSVLITRAVKYKASIVSQDEKEGSIRRILNFGHTIGHALELHESLKHGFAVASGMEMAAVFSERKGLISNDETNRIINLLNRYKLLKKYDMPVERIEEFTAHDKKRTGTDIYYVFLEGIGKGIVEKVPLKEVIEFYRQYNDK